MLNTNEMARRLVAARADTRGCAGCANPNGWAVRNNVCSDCEFTMAENMISPVGLSRDAIRIFFGNYPETA